MNSCSAYERGGRLSDQFKRQFVHRAIDGSTEGPGKANVIQRDEITAGQQFTSVSDEAQVIGKGASIRRGQLRHKARMRPLGGYLNSERADTDREREASPMD